MGEVLVVTSGKGGVGKSTTTANIGAAFAQMGKRVLLIDTDIGLRNLDVVLGMENRIVYDVIDVATGVKDPSQAILSDHKSPGLFFLPAAQTKLKDDLSPEQMTSLCDRLKAEYDYILIDSPAGVEHGFYTAIAPAQSAIVVVTPELSSVRDAERVVGMLETESKIPTERMHLIINRFRPRLAKKNIMMGPEDIISILGIPLSGIIPEDEAVLIANAGGTSVINNPKSLAGKAYRNTAKRIVGEEIPLLDLSGKKLKWQRLFHKEGK